MSFQIVAIFAAAALLIEGVRRLRRDRATAGTLLISAAGAITFGLMLLQDITVRLPL